MIDIEKNKKVKKIFATFKDLNVEVGAILYFTKDEKITCRVQENQRVLLNGLKCSISRAAEIVLEQMGYEWKSVRGYKYWMYMGKTLMELADEFKLRQKK